MNALEPRITRFASELDVTVRRLQWMQAELGQLNHDARMSAPPTIAPTMAPTMAPPIPPGLQPHPLPQAHPLSQAHPVSQAHPGPPFAAPAPHRPPAARKRTEFTGGRILAGLGVLVTLVGVALLLALAIQAGLLGPIGRVGLGVGLAVGLLGGALWLRSRPGGSVGASALAATAIATAYLDTVAVTGIYGWVPPAIGLGVSGVIALGGLWLASRWRSEGLGIAVFAPVYLLAPTLAGSGYLLGGFTVILALASLGIRRPADWQWLHLVRSVGTSVTLAVLAAAASAMESLPALGAALVGAAVGLLAASDMRARAGGSWPLLAAAAIAVVPVLVALPGAPQWSAATAAAATVLGTTVLGMLPTTVRAVRIWWLTLGAFTAAVAVCLLVPLQWNPAILLALAVPVVLATRRDPADALAGLVLAGIGLVVGAELFLATVVTDPTTGGATDYAGSAPVLVAAALTVVLAAALCWRVPPLVTPESRTLVLMSGTVIGLCAAGYLLVNAGWAIAGVDGMRWGHGVATIVWIAVGAAAVLRRRGDRSTTIAGFVLVGAAVAKLFLFDWRCSTAWSGWSGSSWWG